MLRSSNRLSLYGRREQLRRYDGKGGREVIQDEREDRSEGEREDGSVGEREDNVRRSDYTSGNFPASDHLRINRREIPKQRD